jgi:hypothetical protein
MPTQSRVACANFQPLALSTLLPVLSTYLLHQPIIVAYSRLGAVEFEVTPAACRPSRLIEMRVADAAKRWLGRIAILVIFSCRFEVVYTTGGLKAKGK